MSSLEKMWNLFDLLHEDRWTPATFDQRDEYAMLVVRGLAETDGNDRYRRSAMAATRGERPTERPITNARIKKASADMIPRAPSVPVLDLGPLDLPDLTDEVEAA